MTDSDHNSLWIMRLRMSAPASQAIARRLRAEQLLGTIELRPAGLAPSAVLIVRALHMRADLHTSQRLPPAAADARRALAGHYHAAAHPAHGPVPPNAQSVLFADQAELLACLTRDIIAGQVASRWYWRQSLRALPLAPGQALTQAWLADIRLLPATLALLGPAAIEALQRLRPSDIATIALALASAYALPQQLFIPAASSPSECLAEADTALPPWRAWLPAPATLSLAPAAEALLGVALTIWHTPLLSRSEQFAAQAQHWLARDSSAQTRGPEYAAESDPAIRPPVIATKRSAAESPASRSAAARAAATLEAFASQLPASLSMIGTDISASAPRLHEADRSATPPTAPASQAGLLTRLGGVLYLINLLDALGWPRYTPAAAAPMIAGWRLLEAIARTLLAAPDDHGDPLWATLAALDQRDAELPVTGLLDQPARDWLATTAAQIRALAARRLGDPQPELLTRLLAVPARLVVTRTHVDLLLRLDSIDIAARASGLDRDPGWVPELGRIVLFHFD